MTEPAVKIGDISPDFAKALVGAQGEIEGAKKGKANPAFRSKYADLGACWDACRDALQKYQIAVLQFPSSAPPGHVGLVTALVYGPSGEILSEAFSMPLKDPTNAQAAGSAITYARRYALCAVIGICPEDDDGNAASSSKPQTAPAAKPMEWSDADDAAARRGFNGKTTNEERKAYYSKVKAMPIPEPHKTKLLSDFAAVIKGQKA